MTPHCFSPSTSVHLATHIYKGMRMIGSSVVDIVVAEPREKRKRGGKIREKAYTTKEVKAKKPRKVKEVPLSSNDMP